MVADYYYLAVAAASSSVAGARVSDCKVAVHCAINWLGRPLD